MCQSYDIAWNVLRYNTHEANKLITVMLSYRKEKHLKMRNLTGCKPKGAVIRRKYLQMMGKFCRCNTDGSQKTLPVTRLQTEAKESYIVGGGRLPEVRKWPWKLCSNKNQYNNSQKTKQNRRKKKKKQPTKTKPTNSAM